MCGLGSCGGWAELLRGMWDLPGPGIEPVSPIRAGGFSTTEPPRKPCLHPHSLLTEFTHLVSGLNKAQVLEVSSQKEFTERQSDR